MAIGKYPILTHAQSVFLLFLIINSRSHAELEIETIEGSELTTKPPAKGRASNFSPRPVLPKRKPFYCVVCDDIKDKDCQPWNKTSYIKNCYEDPRIEKNQPVGCRKMIQQVGDRTYVSRHCTNLIDDHVQGCIDRVGTRKIKVKYCHCRGFDNCNSGSQPISELLLVTLAALYFRFLF